MESLKPLKIIGGLALLCLIALLCFPEGRLNAGFATRAIGGLKSDYPTGPNAQFLNDFNNVLGSSKNVSGVESVNSRILVAKSALNSGNLSILAMASRRISLPGKRKIDDPLERVAYDEFLRIARELNKSGQHLDSENAFWPMQLATLAEDVAASGHFLKQASECTHYSDFFSEEREVVLNNLSYTPSAYEEVMVLGSVMFPNLAYYKSVCQEYVLSKPLEGGIEGRVIIAKIGKLMATTSDVYIPLLVGRAIAIQATQKAKEEGVHPTPRYTLEELESAAAKKGVETDGIFRGVINMRQDPQPVSFPVIEGWRIIERFGPNFLTLPFLTFVIFGLSPLMILHSQKIADRPWLKSIRYLAILPLSLCFASNSNTAGFHVGTMIIILLVSIPVALISFTEKFIPVVHITTVVLAFNTFYRGENFDNLATETAVIAILTLVAWAKNRNPERAASKWASHILFMLALAAIGIWAVKHFGSGVWPMPNLFNLGLILCSFLAIADADKMQARKQATMLASMGLAAFIATSIVSLRVTHKIREAVPEEIAFVNSQSSRMHAYFDNAYRATKPTDPGVKPIK